MIRSEDAKHKTLSLLIPVLLGVSAYFLVVGPCPLNPLNIAWLREGDPATHYLGWLFYRNSPWEFPIGLNSSYGLELASSILYSDSLPLLAFVFKLFSFLLPQTFQYFGIWLLLCFTFQAVFGWKLVGLVTHSNLIRLLGAGMIVFAPPMICRLHSHLSLVGHFLVVASLYLAFNSNPQRRKLFWGLLLAAAALVHAYLLAMVLAVWIADLVGRMFKRHMSLQSGTLEFPALVLLVGLLCWQVGYFSIRSGVISGGFGYYRMNLLSPLDSSGWSYILRDLPQGPGDYEGFNFVGLGTILLMIISFPAALTVKKDVFKVVRQYWYLLLLFLAFSLFAVSNAIAIGAIEFKFPLPSSLLALANVFRSSGRMFWPVFYALSFASIVMTVRNFDRRIATVVLGLGLTIQILDTSAGWLPIRKKYMAESSSEWTSPFINNFWCEAGNKYHKVRYIPCGNHAREWQTIAYYAARNGLATDAVYLARIDWVNFQAAKRREYEILRSGTFDHDTLYILDEVSFRKAFLVGNSKVDLFAKVDGFNIVAPGWKRCADCSFFGDEIKVHDLFKPVALGERVQFNADGNGVIYLGQGWSSPEPWGTWSDSFSSVVFLPTKPQEVESLVIELNALVSPSHPSQRIGILVNGVEASSMTIREPHATVEVKLPDLARSDSFSGIKIEFLLPDAARPKDIGLGVDNRSLALGLRAITVR